MALAVRRTHAAAAACLWQTGRKPRAEYRSHAVVLMLRPRRHSSTSMSRVLPHAVQIQFCEPRRYRCRMPSSFLRVSAMRESVASARLNNPAFEIHQPTLKDGGREGTNSEIYTNTGYDSHSSMLR